MKIYIVYFYSATKLYSESRVKGNVIMIEKVNLND